MLKCCWVILKDLPLNSVLFGAWCHIVDPFLQKKHLNSHVLQDVGRKHHQNGRRSRFLPVCLFVCCLIPKPQVGMGGHNNRERQAETQRFSGNPTKSKGPVILFSKGKSHGRFFDVWGKKQALPTTPIKTTPARNKGLLRGY